MSLQAELTFGYGCMLERHLSDRPEQVQGLEGYVFLWTRTYYYFPAVVSGGLKWRVA